MLADACNPASVPEYLNVVYDSSSPEVRAGGRRHRGRAIRRGRWTRTIKGREGRTGG